MKEKKHNLLFLGLSIAFVASTSYALISPNDTKVDSTPAFLDAPSSVVINNPTLSDTDSLIEENAKPQTIIHLVKQGDSLSTIFSELDISKVDLHNIIHANELGSQFASITPGKKLFVNFNSDGSFQELVYKKNLIDTLVAARTDNGFNVEVLSKQVEKQITSTQTSISSSLFLDGKEAGLTDKVIMQLADIFAWDIDFALNLRKGDQFTVVYEKLFVEGKQIDTGDIMSAEFVNQGHPYTAVRYKDKNGDVNYFTPDGKGMRKAFLRTPVDFARISSHFNLKRKHPVLNKIRAHKGVDYAARSGTPIKTTGDGKIIFRGRKGGYGRVVIVQHGKKYSSLYAHMSKYKRGQKVGNHVNQGDVIGYVGKSGLATGSHLHYEFRVNGKHRNPLTVKLPHSLPIKKSLLAEFKKQTQPRLALLNKAKASTLLAQSSQ